MSLSKQWCSVPTAVPPTLNHQESIRERQSSLLLKKSQLGSNSSKEENSKVLRAIYTRRKSHLNEKLFLISSNYLLCYIFLFLIAPLNNIRQSLTLSSLFPSTRYLETSERALHNVIPSQNEQTQFWSLLRPKLVLRSTPYFEGLLGSPYSRSMPVMCKEALGWIQHSGLRHRARFLPRSAGWQPGSPASDVAVASLLPWGPTP